MFNFQLPNLDYNNGQSLEINTTTHNHYYNNIFDYDNPIPIEPNPLYDRPSLRNSRNIENILRRQYNRLITIDEDESFEDYMFSDVKTF
jgi:hypothetical protein